MNDIKHTPQGIAEAIEAVNNLDNLDQAAYNAAKLKDAKNLLAAAPELLAALEELIAAPNKKRPQSVWDAAQAAINKAKGV